ncbi:MAG: dolichol kinase [Bacteroidetes bacterium]|nr:dolichol kinase [Bacteroidota bacterium]MBU2585828.1 dolichol kinase [Bacteroidota bacterium]
MLDSAATIEYKNEVIRKLIHLFSLSIPVIYFFISKETALYILVPVTLIFLIIDVVRYYNPQVGGLFYTIFGFILRKHERDEKKKRLNGATNILLSAIICVLIFPKLLFVTAFAVLIVSDISSALVGRKFGKKRFLAKSFAGFLAFLISGFIVIFLTPKVEYYAAEYLIGFIAVFFGGLAESSSLEIDDNISVPISIGAVMWILYSLLLPSINVYHFG